MGRYLSTKPEKIEEPSWFNRYVVMKTKFNQKTAQKWITGLVLCLAFSLATPPILGNTPNPWFRTRRPWKSGCRRMSPVRKSRKLWINYQPAGAWSTCLPAPSPSHNPLFYKEITKRCAGRARAPFYGWRRGLIARSSLWASR